MLITGDVCALMMKLDVFIGENAHIYVLQWCLWLLQMLWKIMLWKVHVISISMNTIFNHQ